MIHSQAKHEKISKALEGMITDRLCIVDRSPGVRVYNRLETLEQYQASINGVGKNDIC